jgi:hypothetical protein
MATTMRSVDTRFWIDGWVRKLNALDRYVFLYFLTNPHSSWCGVYEVDMSMVSFETGVEETELTKVILPRLAPKVRYVDGWVYIPNFEKYHANHSEKTQKGIENAWKVVPERIRLKLKDLYPIEGVSAFASASASALLGDSNESQLKDNETTMGWNNKSDNEDDLPAIDLDTQEPERDLEDERKKKVTALIEWAEKLRGKKFLDTPTQRKFINDMRTANISPTVIKQKYQELLVSEYWQGRTELPDFKTVFSNLKNKK